MEFEIVDGPRQQKNKIKARLIVEAGSLTLHLNGRIVVAITPDGRIDTQWSCTKDGYTVAGFVVEELL